MRAGGRNALLVRYRLAGPVAVVLACAGTAQAALVSALRTFRGNLTSTGTAADGDEVSAGSAALAMLSNSAGAFGGCLC